MMFFCFLYVNIVQGGYYNMGFYDEAWFATHQGLSNVGVDIRNLKQWQCFCERDQSYFKLQQRKNN